MNNKHSSRYSLASLCCFLWLGLSAPASLAAIDSSPSDSHSLPLPAHNRHEQLLLWLETKAVSDEPEPVIEAKVTAKIATKIETQASSPQLLIIIDDIGNNLQQGLETIALPGDITLAVLPFTPHARSLAERGHQSGKEIMLHMPMQNHRKLNPGPGTLTMDMAEDVFRLQLKAAIESIPHVQGLNNHMGSLMTEQRQQMDWTMQTLQQEQLFFVDSRTTAQTVAAQSAAAHRIPHLSRQVFLDHHRDLKSISQAFERGLKIAEAEGHAILIGHPYAETIAVLKAQIPAAKARGVQFISAANLLKQEQLRLSQL